ncbi:LLM class flavin-dependent oxidoreductase [Actinomadura madurae]|uniref:LLM class flavin-dependent oxidoreductase n=1 Tax=Actinomadura madurae TaxID=1993 RepID=UPI000D854593|nr:LLM class flavin-dependent oxidoreductase [Actinomadura madurae]SPT64003.1 Nitrilotriacetate monooxygenase component A [Actinomadura madurae]
MLHLMTPLLALGSHLAGWRHPKAWTRQTMNLDQAIELAKIAEAGKFDLVFLADGNAVRQMDKPALFEANSQSDRPAGFEPLTLLSAISQHTEHIGLLATATTTYEEPYLLARRFASLDHLSKGRACWNIVTGSYPGDSVNFGFDKHVDKAVRYERADEFVDACKGLWDSWAADAFIEDQNTGRYLDASRVHTLNHKGKHFSVQGPLNIARMPQGYPVLFLAGQSEAGRELAAKQADCVFSVSNTLPEAQEFYADIKGRLDRYGRAPDSLKVMPGCTVYVGRSEAEADDLYRALQELITPDVGVAYLSKLVDMDLSAYDCDGPMPDLSVETNAIAAFRVQIGAIVQRENLTIRQAYERVLPSMGHTIFKGTALQVADEMEEWYRGKGADGFLINAPIMPSGLHDFVDLVVPELQRRGLFRTAYEGGTLRDRLGLPTPRNPFFD